jgi:Fe-Mn family superoxide dismutase
MQRREVLKLTAAGMGALAGAALFNTSEANGQLYNNETKKYELPPLPYPYEALEPHIDAQTMRLHHDIHHLSYVNGLNNALTKLEEARTSGDFSLVKHWSREAAFHGAGHLLHVLFWNTMAPAKGSDNKPTDPALVELINQSFGSFDQFKKHFAAASTTVEASGWGILAFEPTGNRLVILQAEKHQNLSQWTAVPILALDVWEHAYYLKYQNRRGEYVNNWFNVINWDAVAKYLAAARS